MKDLSRAKIIITSITGTLCSLLINLFGEWNTEMETLIIFMILDYLTGIICAAVFKKSKKTENGSLESKVGWKGLAKKCYILLFVLIAHRLDLALDVEYVKTTVIIGFVINEGLSIIENAGLIGIPLPSSLKNAIEILQNKIDS